jgi:hypothetical protein
MFSLQHGFAKVFSEKSRLVGLTSKAIDFHLSTDLKNFSWSTVWSNGQNDGYHTSAQISRNGSRIVWVTL